MKVYTSLILQKKELAGTALGRMVAPDRALDAIASGTINAVLSDGYLIVYDIGQTWHSYGTYVVEQLVRRIDPGPGNLRSVLATLEALRQNHAAAGIITGVSTSDPRMDRFYRRAGFTPIGAQYIKER